jgi:hypothetical protein
MNGNDSCEGVVPVSFIRHRYFFFAGAAASWKTIVFPS